MFFRWTDLTIFIQFLTNNIINLKRIKTIHSRMLIQLFKILISFIMNNFLRPMIIIYLCLLVFLQDFRQPNLTFFLTILIISNKTISNF
jgi:hypothetical protein